MTFILGLIHASRGIQIVALVLSLWGAFELNNALQRQRGRSEGVSSTVTTIEKKASENVATAEEVRTEIAAGKRGRDDPSRLRDPGKGRAGN